MICLEFYHRSIKTRYVLKCISVLLFFIVIGLYWNSLSSTLQTRSKFLDLILTDTIMILLPKENFYGCSSVSDTYPLWNRRFINQLFWAGIVSLIFSIITLFAYGYGNQEIFDLSLGICLCVLHYSEWCLYMTVSISESWICISSTINIIFVLLGSANMKQSSLQKSAFAIANRGSAIKLFRWHVLSACCLVPAFLKLALLWINKYIDDSSTHNTLNHRVHFEKGFVLGLYLMILGFICSERMYLCVRELAAQLLKFPIFVTCFTQFHAFIQSISMLAYFHSAVVLVWPQIVLFMYPKGELSLSSNNHVLIQFSCSCLMTSFALILPSVINSNTTSCEMYTQSRSIGKLGFLLLVWTINSRQLELNLLGS
ncbi:unnamed protein product [Heterobilharzia americana]|nr:unnamed protein product [Heterobilharzia americana]